MYIHIGDDIVVPIRDIVAIFDFKINNSPIVEDFLSGHAETIISTAGGSPRSFVVTEKNVYLSPLSSRTLKKRASCIPHL
ncbi:extracellular matrix/biofilm biosynthesis regulator RemA family protein [Bacillus gobiensis]|uniref:extracellular matrix regulator RemB n=1 Tax=Bacillus gobiensis TaxID=1441095 RepID=UPI003D191676